MRVWLGWWTACLQSAPPIFALVIGARVGAERATARKVALLGSSFCVAAAYVWVKRQPDAPTPAIRGSRRRA